MALSNQHLIADGLHSVHVTGTATNVNPFKVKNPIVTVVLVDNSMQMVSLGYRYIMVEDIGPNASVDFDVRVESRPYVDYRTYVQAERDWQ